MFDLKPFLTGACPNPAYLACLTWALPFPCPIVVRRMLARWGSKATYLSFFPKEGRENLVIAVPSDGGNVLTKENLVRALDLFEEISAFPVTYEVSSNNSLNGVSCTSDVHVSSRAVLFLLQTVRFCLAV